jgi:hypothetical protein
MKSLDLHIFASSIVLHGHPNKAHSFGSIITSPEQIECFNPHHKRKPVYEQVARTIDTPIDYACSNHTLDIKAFQVSFDRIYEVLQQKNTFTSATFTLHSSRIGVFRAIQHVFTSAVSTHCSAMLDNDASLSLFDVQKPTIESSMPTNLKHRELLIDCSQSLLNILRELCPNPERHLQSMATYPIYLDRKLATKKTPQPVIAINSSNMRAMLANHLGVADFKNETMRQHGWLKQKKTSNVVSITGTQKQ